jgi:quinoprotein glucose dehydrogenase
MLHAIDADSGEVKWTAPAGNWPARKGDPVAPPEYGSPLLGGPIVTAGGLIFMGASFDPAIRAYDVATGKELWKGDLPLSARSTPMTFRGPDGRQYVVIAAGGHTLGPPGDSLVAFTLP